MAHQVENQTHSPIYQNLFSKQLFPKDPFPTQAPRGQQTVCPPNTDSSPGKVLLNQGTQRQTSRHKTVYAKGDAIARNKRYDAPHGSATQHAMEQRTI